MNLNDFLKLWIYSFRKRQEYKILLGQMVTHLAKCPIENNLKGMKMRKISKMYRDIDSLSNVSLLTHHLAMVWLSFRWRKREMENGFIDISVRLRGGRNLETRKKATEHIFSVAEKFLKPILEKYPFALSMEMRNIDPELSPKVNSIPNFMKES